MSEFERKFGKYAIRNLTKKVLIYYIFAYLFFSVSSVFDTTGLIYMMTFEPYEILHGQIWRLITWVLIPPIELTGGGIFLTLIAFYFYYSIGTTMENVWGTYRYNVYMLMGCGLTIVFAFIAYALIMLIGRDSYYNGYFYISINTSYLLMSVLLAFAATFPDHVILFMFIIPMKMKWLGIIDAVIMGYALIGSLISLDFATVATVLAAFATLGVFWFTSGRLMHLRPKEIKRRNDFKRSAKMTPPGITKHKCAVCGRTESDDPNLEFRFCSKCNGNYEYCSEHLFTHTHVK